MPEISGEYVEIKKKFSKFGSRRSFPKGRNTFMPRGKNSTGEEDPKEEKEKKKGLYGSWKVKMF